MGPAPWWLTVLVGACTVAGSFLVVRIWPRRAHRSAAEQRERASARAEWFRRFRWAAELTLQPEPAAQTAGFAALDVLAESELASKDDVNLLAAVQAAADIAAAKSRLNRGR